MASEAWTWKVCEPALSPEYETGLVQLANAAASSEQAKVAAEELGVKLNCAEVDVVGLVGWLAGDGGVRHRGGGRGEFLPLFFADQRPGLRAMPGASGPAPAPRTAPQKFSPGCIRAGHSAGRRGVSETSAPLGPLIRS